jgi:DNA repair photolyase
MSSPPAPRGRGAHANPPNRFTLLMREPDPEVGRVPTRYLVDSSASIISENDSPDIPFRYSLNPYRGCQHGCAFCYARPTHEYLGLGAGIDFEAVIFVKQDAPGLFRDFLNRPGWRPESITLSGVTDPYQPCERDYRLTRGCLEVALEACQPLSLITRSALIERDLDLLAPLAAGRLVHVAISLTTLDADLARSMEPRASIPAARLRAIRALTDAGVPVRAFVAPIIPGLNDHEIPATLEAARAAGAHAASYILLRLPLTVAPVFLDWLRREQPGRADRVEARIRDTRGGKLNEPAFGRRMRGTGETAEQIRQLFRLFARKHGLDGKLPDYDCSRFRPPRPRGGQGWLF